MFRILNELEAKLYIPLFVLSLSTLCSCITSFSTHISLQLQVQAGEHRTKTGTYEIFMTAVQYPLQQAFSLLSVVSPKFNNNLTSPNLNQTKLTCPNTTQTYRFISKYVH
jgi:hypothetical protein